MKMLKKVWIIKLEKDLRMERFIKHFFARVCPFNYIKVSHQEGKNMFVLMSTMISKKMN